MDELLKLRKNWQRIVAKYQNPQRSKSIGQLCNTLIPYIILWGLMAASLKVSYWLTLALAVVAGGFLVRLFIIFHDCGHRSFFKSEKANRFWGYITGVLCFTPTDYWWSEHSRHHATAGDLDHRGVGDVWTMTVEEYLQATRWTRIKYRFARNPVCLFLIAPAFLFLVVHRFPRKIKAGRSVQSVHATNLGILLTAAALSLGLGLKSYLMIQLPVVIVAASAGVWLFYVQHQFEGVYWERNPKWDYFTEALKGSSFYKLPRVLQWFTGNIGYHHVHHLSPRIPNYFLERCHKEAQFSKAVKAVTFLASLKSLTFRLWDEQHGRLVGFGYLKKLKYA